MMSQMPPVDWQGAIERLRLPDVKEGCVTLTADDGQSQLRSAP
jgi:hypothetical protein